MADDRRRENGIDCGLAAVLAENTADYGLPCLALFTVPTRAVLAELFPVRARYFGPSDIYILAGVLGVAAAPVLAQWGVSGCGGWGEFLARCFFEVGR